MKYQMLILLFNPRLTLIKQIYHKGWKQYSRDYFVGSNISYVIFFFLSYYFFLWKSNISFQILARRTPALWQPHSSFFTPFVIVVVLWESASLDKVLCAVTVYRMSKSKQYFMARIVSIKCCLVGKFGSELQETNQSCLKCG